MKTCFCNASNFKVVVSTHRQLSRRRSNVKLAAICNVGQVASTLCSVMLLYIFNTKWRYEEVYKPL